MKILEIRRVSGHEFNSYARRNSQLRLGLQEGWVFNLSPKCLELSSLSTFVSRSQVAAILLPPEISESISVFEVFFFLKVPWFLC